MAISGTMGHRAGSSAPSEVVMSVGGGSSSDDAFLIGPILEWWDKRTAKRDAKKAAKAEARERAAIADASQGGKDNGSQD